MLLGAGHDTARMARSRSLTVMQVEHMKVETRVADIYRVLFDAAPDAKSVMLELWCDQHVSSRLNTRRRKPSPLCCQAGRPTTHRIHATTRYSDSYLAPPKLSTNPEGLPQLSRGAGDVRCGCHQQLHGAALCLWGLIKELVQPDGEPYVPGGRHAPATARRLRGGRGRQHHHGALVWDVSIIDTVMKDFYNKSIDTMVDALQTNLTEGWSDDVGHWENCANKKATCANDSRLKKGLSKTELANIGLSKTELANVSIRKPLFLDDASKEHPVVLAP